MCTSDYRCTTTPRRDASFPLWGSQRGQSWGCVGYDRGTYINFYNNDFEVGYGSRLLWVRYGNWGSTTRCHHYWVFFTSSLVLKCGFKFYFFIFSFPGGVGGGRHGGKATNVGHGNKCTITCCILYRGYRAPGGYHRRWGWTSLWVVFGRSIYPFTLWIGYIFCWRLRPGPGL